MSCEIVATQGAVFCVWGKPTRSDVDRVEAQLRASALEFGGPVTYITRVPAQAPAPDGDVRKYLNAAIPRIMASCSTYHVVLEGVGFVAAMKRGILTSLFQLGFRKGSFFVHSSVEEVRLRVAKAVRPNVDELLKVAAKKALLTRSEFASVPAPPLHPSQPAR
jgi:hypothetical protein